jgi:hypothetical protein
MLAYLDGISAICVMAIMMSINNLLWLFIFYVLLTVVTDIVQRLDSSLLFSITKNKVKERSMLQISSGTISLLSLIAPSICAFVIQMLGYKYSLFIDIISFVIGAFLYYLISLYVQINRDTIGRNQIKNSQASDMFLCFDLKMMSAMFIVISLLSNLESPLIFNYLSIERHFSEAEVGFGMTVFSLGMTIGSYLFKFIPRMSAIVFAVLMLLDGLFTVFLSYPIGKILITICYLAQGIFVMFMILAFNTNLQSKRI